ncbi:MAG: hypothetical protein WBM32_06865, partial [Crocosphaera sp.]
MNEEIMTPPSDSNSNNSNGKDKNNRFGNFAQFFKGYMSVSTIIVAALPIPVAAFDFIPSFEDNRQFLATYTSFFCFLILAFSFYSRYRLAWWMFHNELNGRNIGFAKQIKTVIRIIPFLLIVISLLCIIGYHQILGESIKKINCELASNALEICGNRNNRNQQNQDQNSGSSDNNKNILDQKAYLQYFAQSIKLDEASFDSNIKKLNSQFILQNADSFAIYNNWQLILLYLGIFLSAETA